MATNAEMLIQRIMSNDGRSYEQLGLEASNASRITVKEVEKAYRSIARFVHPDNCGLAQAKEAFQKLNEAYRKIIDFKTVCRRRAPRAAGAIAAPAAGRRGRRRRRPRRGRRRRRRRRREGGRPGEPRVQDGLVVGLREAARAQEAGAPAGAGARARREEGARGAEGGGAEGRRAGARAGRAGGGVRASERRPPALRQD